MLGMCKNTGIWEKALGGIGRVLVKIIYGKCLWMVRKICGIDTAKKIDSYLRFHRKLNLKNPTTLADKVCWIELHAQSPLAPACTDKFEVRKYVSEKGYGHTLVPLAWEGVWNCVDEIDFDSLPESFVIKATHGCKMNYFVPDKSKLDVNECKKRLNHWLNTTYGLYSMEPHYENIPHRLYAECYLGDMSGLIDYKFFCLNGVPRYVVAYSNRKADENKHMQVTLDLYDMDWNVLPGLKQFNNEVPGSGTIPKPKLFEKMKEMARGLAQDLKFVRIDLYELNEQIYFGEMTFSPACCVFPCFSEKLIKDMGEDLKL